MLRDYQVAIDERFGRIDVRRLAFDERYWLVDVCFVSVIIVQLHLTFAFAFFALFLCARRIKTFEKTDYLQRTCFPRVLLVVLRFGLELSGNCEDFSSKRRQPTTQREQRQYGTRASPLRLRAARRSCRLGRGRRRS